MKFFLKISKSDVFVISTNEFEFFFFSFLKIEIFADVSISFENLNK